MALLALLFLVVPLVELWLLLTIGGAIGFWPTFAIAIVSALVGGYLAKREGLRVFRAWSTAMAQMRVPNEGLASGLLVLVGGVLLVTPGFLTDITGLLLLFPPTRRIVASAVRKRIERKMRDAAEGKSSGGWNVRVVSFGGMGESPRRRVEPDVIDVEGEIIEEEPERRLPRRTR